MGCDMRLNFYNEQGKIPYDERLDNLNSYSLYSITIDNKRDCDKLLFESCSYLDEYKDNDIAFNCNKIDWNGMKMSDLHIHNIKLFDVKGFQGPTYALTDDMPIYGMEYCNGFIRVRFYVPNCFYNTTKPYTEMFCKKVLFIG